MPSWQSYIIHPILRFSVKRKLARVSTPQAARDAMPAPPPPPPGASYEADVVAGVPGEWVTSGIAVGTLLYLHGGGYFSCSPATHRSITAGFAQRGLKTFAVDYRLAPEHPFPAGLDDALAVYRGLLGQGIAADQLVVGGDSAGGGLALGLLLAIKQAGLPMPCCAVLFSPWTDLAVTGASVLTNSRRESMLVSAKLGLVAAGYLDGADPRDPLASPLYGDLAGLPPLLIQVGEPEALRDDSVRLAERAEAAGVRVDLSVWDNMPHVWQLNTVFLPEARQAMDAAVAFAKTQLALALSPAAV